jgi:DNA-binding transcriptional MocR family regulator
MFIPIERTSHVPVYLQIRESLRKLILRGTLRPGERLPSTRQLASNLGVNRITVEAALRKLEAEGLISSHVGRGTFVNRPATPSEPKAAPARPDPESLSRFWGPLFVDLRPARMGLPALNVRPSAKVISFVAAAPGPDLFPAVEFRRCMDFVLKRRLNEIARVGPSDGLPSLRSYLARWFTQNGLEASEDEVLITTGCQQSMELIRKTLVAPGDAIMMENPTYPGAVAALASGSPERLELPVQDGGPDLQVFHSLGGGTRCKLVYVVPNFHNPTGHTMPLEARQQLAALAGQLRIPIIEDDVFGQLRYSGPALPPLKCLAPHLVIYIGSFSKVLSPALRLGWILAPRPAVKQLQAVKQATDLHTNVLMQAAMEEFCRRDLLHRHLKRVRRIFAKRRDAMAEALRRYFPSDARWELPNGGLSMWVSLFPECNTEELLPTAHEHGVQFLPGSAFYFRSPLYNSLRLSFAAEDEQRIQEGTRILGDLVSRQRRHPMYASGWAEPAGAPIM